MCACTLQLVTNYVHVQWLLTIKSGKYNHQIIFTQFNSSRGVGTG